MRSPVSLGAYHVRSFPRNEVIQPARRWIAHESTNQLVVQPVRRKELPAALSAGGFGSQRFEMTRGGLMYERGFSIGVGRRCRGQLYDLLRGLIPFIARKFPYRHKSTCQRIIKRTRVWRPPRDAIAC